MAELKTARPLWGIEEVAGYLDVPVNTVYAWRCKGYGPKGRKVGKYVRYRPADVEAWFLAQDSA